MKKGFYLVAILLFPSIIYMLFSFGEHHVEKMPSYGRFEVNDEGDTIYQRVPELNIQLADGSITQLSEFADRALVLNLFEMPCDDACRKKGATLANYLNELGGTDKWAIINLCITENTDVSELNEIAKAHDIGMKNWYFVSAVEANQLNEFLTYIFVETKMAESLDMLPNDNFVLLDQSHVVREFFNSRIYKENKKMEDAIKMVLKEPHMSWKNK